MPGLEFKNLPANQEQEIKDTLHGQWRIEANALGKSWFANRGAFETAKAKLNAKYQRLELDAMTKVQQQQREQQQKQELISGYRKEHQAGGMTPQRRAQIEAKYTEEEEVGIFGKPQPKPYTFQQLQGLSKFIKGSVGEAEQEPWYHPGKEKTRKSLINKYLAVTDMLKVSDPDFGLDRQQTFNKMWNYVMKEDPDQFANWFDKKGKPPVEMKIATSDGKVTSLIKDKVLGMSPIGKSLVGAGLGKGTRAGAGIGRGMPQQQQQQRVPQGSIRVKSPAGQTGSIPASQWAEAQAAGYTRVQ